MFFLQLNNFNRIEKKTTKKCFHFYGLNQTNSQRIMLYKVCFYFHQMWLYKLNLSVRILKASSGFIQNGDATATLKRSLNIDYKLFYHNKT